MLSVGYFFEADNPEGKLSSLRVDLSPQILLYIDSFDTILFIDHKIISETTYLVTLPISINDSAFNTKHNITAQYKFCVSLICVQTQARCLSRASAVGRAGAGWLVRRNTIKS